MRAAKADANQAATIRVLVPIHLESTLNLREHWAGRAKRNASHRAAAWFALKAAMPKFDPAIMPCVVTLTRVAPRELDDDNLAACFKSVRDGVADWLFVDDRDPRVQWKYAQRKGAVREYAAEIAIEPVEAAA